MKTRTLLLLAVTCGLAILLAGGVQLWRLANQQTDPLLEVGQSGAAGDARVRVDAFEEHDGVALVTVTLSGVADAGGLDGFTLVGPGATVQPGPGDDACAGFTVQAVTCTLTFDTAEVKDGSRLLLFRRAEQQARWKLV
jgi:HAMP domain-containing protein